MTTDGGGWTIVGAVTGADGEEPFVTDTAVSGDPLAFEAYSLTRQQKAAISATSGESLFVRCAVFLGVVGLRNVFLKVDAPMFGVAGELTSAENVFHEYVVTVTSSDGTADSSGHIGWSNFNIAQSGDFAITNSTGTSQHSTNYQMLNSACGNSYLYSYSNSPDSDAGYDVNTPLGNWGRTSACHSGEGGTLALYAAMRPSDDSAAGANGTAHSGSHAGQSLDACKARCAASPTCFGVTVATYGGTEITVPYAPVRI
jgi:hypothetical protein